MFAPTKSAARYETQGATGGGGDDLPPKHTFYRSVSQITATIKSIELAPHLPLHRFVTGHERHCDRCPL